MPSAIIGVTQILTDLEFHKPSLDLGKIGRYYSVYAYFEHINLQNQEETNIAVLEAFRRQKDGKHVDYYCGTFQGPHSAELTIQQFPELFQSLVDILALKNKVTKKDLEAKLDELTKN